ncbi:MAG: PHP domain-containing protein [Bacillota bacterium]|nr:PHP domain-containing protein [Bacillota bacterium]
MYKKGDFHLHTNESDGKLSPRQLVNLAKENQIDIMAVTDHDTTKGVQNAIDEGKKQGIRVIPGIELSTLHEGESIHILAYFKDESFRKTSFQNFLEEMTNYRVKRAIKIVENLDKFFNIKVDYKKMLDNAEGVVARPHIARAIIDAGYPYTIDYIFKHIIHSESPAYIPNKKLGIAEGIEFLRSVNSVIVLAHPVLIRKSNVEDLMKFDFDGIEAIYGLNSPQDTERLVNLANKYNKLITAGSDFHNDDADDTKHGTIGCVSLDQDGISKFLNIYESK